MKKGNLSVFFIFGILMVVIALFFWFAGKNIQVEQYAQTVKDFQKEKESFESYTNGCLKASTEKAIERYGLSYQSEQFNDYLKNQFFACMNNFEDYEAKGYLISYDGGSVNLTINDKRIETVLDMKLEFSKGDEKATFDRFTSRYELPPDYKDPVDGEWIFRGILYKYIETKDPRPMHIFIVKVDLEDPTIKFFVTPRIAPGVMTTSDFLSKYGAQLAINGDVFDIGATNEVGGYAASSGEVYSAPDLKPDLTFFFSEKNIPSYNKHDGPVYNAISGQNLIMEKGEIGERLFPDHPLHKKSYENLQPSTTLGEDINDKWLIMIVVDGRDPGISEGIRLMELANMYLNMSIESAINMDGGGSTTLVVEGKGVLNNPSTGHERPVANHLGVYAEKLKNVEITGGNQGLDQNTNVEEVSNEAATPDGNDGSTISKYRVVSPGIGAGGQPSAEGYKWLASQGYKTIIDVQGIDNSRAANAAGLKYVYLPYPGSPPSSSWINNVVSAMSDQNSRPVYVHCQYGEHRTGVAIAIYREQIENVCYQQAYDELMRWADNYFPGTDQEKQSVFSTIKSYASC